MLTTKLVVRVLDADNQILAWTEVSADARGDGCLWAARTSYAGVERAGTPVALSVHWADVNVEVRTPLVHEPVQPGQIMTLEWSNRPVLTVGPMPGELPPVTVRGAVAIGVPVGGMGVVAR